MTLRSLPAVALALTLAAPCYALPVLRNLLELIDEAEDVVVFAVDRVEGPEYGRKAVGRVERSFKGRVRGALELPFRYNEWPAGDFGMVFVGCDEALSFEAGKRYLAILKAAPANDDYLNPFRARTTYEVIPLENAIYAEGGDLGMPSAALVGFVRAWRAKGSARIERLSKLARHPSDRARLEAVSCLEGEDSPLVTPLLLERLKNDRTERVRASAAGALALRPGGDVAAALFATLEREPSKQVRDEVVMALGRRKDRGSIAKLVGAFPGADPDLQDTILVAASQEPWLLPDLIRIHELARSDYSRHTSLLLIGDMGTAEAARFLTSIAMGSGDLAERTTALHALARTGRSGPVEEILELATLPCSAENDFLLAALVHTVASIGEPEQVLEVCRRLRACTERYTQSAVTYAASVP